MINNLYISVCTQIFLLTIYDILITNEMKLKHVLIKCICIAMLFYSPVAVPLTQKTQRYFRISNGTLWFSDVMCTGRENSLTDCHFHYVSGRFGSHGCYHSQEVGVMCFNQSGL